MVMRRHLRAAPGIRSVNRAAALCFPRVNTTRCLRLHGLRGPGKRRSEASPATVAVAPPFVFVGPCRMCRVSRSTAQTGARCEEEQEEGEEAHAPAGIHGAGRGAEQVGQAPDEGVGRVQAGGGPGLLPLPSPPHIEGDDDPHRQAAEVANGVTGRPLFFVGAVFAVLAFRGFRPNAAEVSAGAPARPQQCGQSLQCDQRRGEEQHRTVRVAEKDQEAEGDDVDRWSQLGRPGIRDAKEAQKSCEEEKKMTSK